MIDTSQLFQESLRFSRSIFTKIDIVYNGVVLENDIPISTASVSTDRTSNTRFGASVDLAQYPWQSLPITSEGTRLRIHHGIESIGTKESIQLGEYQVFEHKRTNGGAIAVTLRGLENYLIEASFIQPRTPPYGASTVATIAALIHEVLPDAEVVVACSYDRSIRATGAWEKERWKAITQLADSIYAEVYAGHDGRFYIADAPDLFGLVPVFELNGGSNGVLLEEARSSTRDEVYNAVSVSGQSSDQNAPPVWGWARDNDPASPTYYSGPYGKRVRFYSSQFFTSDAQCETYAFKLLAESLAPNETLSLQAGPLPILVAGDAVRLTSEQPGHPRSLHLLQKTKLSLSGGSWAADVLSPKNTEEAA